MERILCLDRRHSLDSLDFPDQWVDQDFPYHCGLTVQILFAYVPGGYRIVSLTEVVPVPSMISNVLDRNGSCIQMDRSDLKDAVQKPHHFPDPEKWLVLDRRSLLLVEEWEMVN